MCVCTPPSRTESLPRLWCCFVLHTQSHTPPFSNHVADVAHSKHVFLLSFSVLHVSRLSLQKAIFSLIFCSSFRSISASIYLYLSLFFCLIDHSSPLSSSLILTSHQVYCSFCILPSFTHSLFIYIFSACVKKTLRCGRVVVISLLEQTGPLCFHKAGLFRSCVWLRQGGSLR